MTEHKRVQLYYSPDYECSYLPDQTARSCFVDPHHKTTPAEFSAMLAAGLRRSGRFVYRPACQECSACISIRVNVAQFRPNRSQRRVLKANTDLFIRERAPKDEDEIYDLYRRYLLNRHADGDMNPQDRSAFRDFLCSTAFNARFVEFRSPTDELISISVIDRLPDSLSAVYTFFDPDSSKRSLGTLAILNAISRAQTSKRQWLYLGYWIKDCRKMSYKSQFSGSEILVNGQWQPLEH